MQSLCSTFIDNDLPPSALTFILLCNDDHLLHPVRPTSGTFLKILKFMKLKVTFLFQWILYRQYIL